MQTMLADAHADMARAGHTIPYGRRTPRGKLRWYLAQVPEGREQATCDALLRLLPASVLEDAFFMRKECWMKRAGTWFLQEKPAYKGYIFIASRDAVALERELGRLSFLVRLVGAEGRFCTPIADGARVWYEAAMDRNHVLRSSFGHMTERGLVVDRGPLVGHEERIVEINRHKRFCRVRVLDADGGFIESMPLVALTEGECL